jgi:translation initiation factor 2 beta subunit (eIF-2beta)/eIF-5
MNLPLPAFTSDGKNTVVSALRETAESLGRPLEHLIMFIAMRTQARSIVIYPSCVVINNLQLSPHAPQQLIAEYLENCMRCKKCNSLSKTILTCASCGSALSDIVPPEMSSHVAEVLE